MKIYFFALFVILFLILSNNVNAQSKGEPVKKYNPDTVYTFVSPRPLISSIDKDYYNRSWGINLLLSNNGFGAGFFYQISLGDNYYAFTSLYISGARNTDEFEYYYPDGVWRVPNKINRLYMFPLTVGIEKFILTSELSEGLKPYISAGLGPTFIISTPYQREFFNAFGYADFYTRFGAFIGFGAYFGAGSKTLSGINLRYYYIPFGNNGLESVINSPIKDFGGVFLSLILGVKF